MWSGTSSVRSASVRSASVHSVSRSISSHYGSRDYDSDRSSETAADEEYTHNRTASQLWHPQDGLSQKLEQVAVQVAELQPRTLIPMYRHGVDSQPESETHSQGSTLGGREDFEHPEKTPTSLQFRKRLESDEEYPHEPLRHEERRVVGPLEQQLSALMSKVIFMERENPTISVTPEQYQALQDRVKALEAEKETWTPRHEALFALRDEDVSNLIKVRVLLAEERWEHTAMRKLRDDDLGNVISLRNRLAEATRKLDAMEKSGRMTPSRRPRSIVALERRDTTDLFQVARTAALEHRALELEKANDALQRQLASVKLEGGPEEGEQKWREIVSDLQAQLRQKEDELSRARQSSASSDPMSWNRIEAMLDENTKYREKMAQRMQQLRSEKEVLQKELHRKEDENTELEAKMEKLQRLSNAGLLQRILR